MIELYINNNRVDLNESIGLNLNKIFEDLEKPTNYFAEYSKTVSLPMTANNKLIFNNFNRQDHLVIGNKSIDPRNKIPFVLLWSGRLIMEGNVRLVNANTAVQDNKFEIELFSSFGAVMNEFSQITFNPYECNVKGGDKDNKYLIETPFQNGIKVNRNLIKESFESDIHNYEGNDVLDFLKFIPTYQGKYNNFESGKEQIFTNRVEDLSQERDEHYTRDFRSYYQQPTIWVNKLWKMAKDKLEDLTDFKLILDKSWFNSQNPYWTDLLYTCPSLLDGDKNFKEKLETFSFNNPQYEYNITSMSNLSSSHKKKIFFNHKSGDNIYGSDGVFNKKLEGPTELNTDVTITLLANKPNVAYESNYCKIRKDNPVFVSFQAINADTNQPIPNTKYTYLCMSGETNYTNTRTYDEQLDFGITFSMRPNIDYYPEGYGYNDGYWFFKKGVKLNIKVNENVPYYIAVDTWCANNSKSFEYAALSFIPKWDWMWTDFFWSSVYHDTREGYTFFVATDNCSVKTVDYLRSNSDIDMYRVFPKDTTLLNVILNYSKMFGLLWDVDEDNKKITVMSRNKYFQGYKVYDWSDKLDKSKDFILEPLCFNKRYVEFNVDEGKGSKYESYNSKYLIGYGAKKLDTNYQFNTDVEKMYEGIKPSLVSQKSQFSRMENTEHPDSPNFVGYSHKVYPEEHYVENDNEGSNAGNCGAFFFHNGTFEPDRRLGYSPVIGKGIIFISDDTEYMMYHDEYCWNFTGSDTTYSTKIPDISTIDRSGRYSVHFESPKEYYYNVSTSNVRYIYDLFWKSFIDERYNVQNKKLTAYFYLTPYDYSLIKFKDFVMIGNVLYHINKVFDYNFDSNSPTKVELCQVWNIEAYTKGQYQFPVLDTDTNNVTISKDYYTDILVYSNNEWWIESKPTWCDVRLEGDVIHIRANTNAIRTRLGDIVLKNNSDIIKIVHIRQRATFDGLRLGDNNLTVESKGGSFTIDVHSDISAVHIVNKPNWCDVTLRKIDTLFGTIGSDYVMSVNINRNRSSFVRSGNIEISNSNSTENLIITQLATRFITEQLDDEIIDIPIGRDSYTFQLVTPDEIDVNTFSITRGSSVKPTQKVNRVGLTFTPTLNTDVTDNTPEICTGGQIVVKKMNGEVIMKNYNYGEVMNSYDVVITPGEHACLIIDGDEYDGTYYSSLPSGSTIEVDITLDDDYDFIVWSDGVNTRNRVITVTENVDIHPILYYNPPTPPPTEEPITFDNGETIEFDNNIKITL